MATNAQPNKMPGASAQMPTAIAAAVTGYRLTSVIAGLVLPAT